MLRQRVRHFPQKPGCFHSIRPLRCEIESRGEQARTRARLLLSEKFLPVNFIEDDRTIIRLSRREFLINRVRPRWKFSFIPDCPGYNTEIRTPESVRRLVTPLRFRSYFYPTQVCVSSLFRIAFHITVRLKTIFLEIHGICDASYGFSVKFSLKWMCIECNTEL